MVASGNTGLREGKNIVEILLLKGTTYRSLG
jgi:hypothetical protein